MTDSPLTVPTVAGRPCSVAAALELVGERWALLAVREVILGNHRFSTIARNTGAPRDRLAARLKDLVAVGVLEQRQYQSAPPRAEYHLTRAGRDLWPVIQALREWGDRWAADTQPLRVRHRDHELRLGDRCATCGEPVRAEDVTREVLAPGWELAGPLDRPGR